jgi:hypothetical protein
VTVDSVVDQDGLPSTRKRNAVHAEPDQSSANPFRDNFRIADHSGGDAICKHKRVFQDLTMFMQAE